MTNLYMINDLEFSVFFVSQCFACGGGGLNLELRISTAPLQCDGICRNINADCEMADVKSC